MMNGAQVGLRQGTKALPGETFGKAGQRFRLCGTDRHKRSSVGISEAPQRRSAQPRDD
jgi:hypothetical protein